MMKTAVIAGGLATMGFETVHAADIAVIATPPTALNVVLLVGAVVCAVAAYQVHGLVRGGALSKSWRYFLAGFAFLALSQLVSFLEALAVVALPSFVVPALLVVMAAFFLLGVLDTRRTLE